MRIEGVRLGVVAHEEDFGEVLAAGIAGDAKLRVDREGFVDRLLNGGLGRCLGHRRVWIVSSEGRGSGAGHRPLVLSWGKIPEDLFV